MFSTVLKEITGYLDKRFVLSIFFPSLTFWGLALVLVVITQGSAQTLKAWGRQPTEVRAFLIILFLAWVTFFAYLLANHLTALTRLYEGYWEWMPGHERIAGSRRRYYQAELTYLWQKLEALDKGKKELDCQLASTTIVENRETIGGELEGVEKERQRLYEEIYLYFPPPTRLDSMLPTRLGNILKSAELYPMLRYKIDAVLIWPRLYTLLPEAFSKTLADAKSSVDLMLIVSFLGFWFAILGGGYLLLARTTWTLFLITFWGGLLVGWLGYKSAIEAALAYAQLIKSAFDLHRGTVIKALGLKAPTSLKEERTLWDNVDKYLYRGFLEKPEAFQYAVPEKPKEGST